MTFDVLSAAHLLGRDIIVQMQPSVGSELYPFNHVLGLVLGPWLLVSWHAVQDRGPQECASGLWPHRNIQIREVRCTWY